MCVCLKVEPPRAWYYRIFPNFRTLVILLQVDPAFGDEPETIYEGCYEIKNTFIFTWSLVLDVGHNLIHQLSPNNKTNYLVHTIQRILDFLQL